MRVPNGFTQFSGHGAEARVLLEGRLRFEFGEEHKLYYGGAFKRGLIEEGGSIKGDVDIIQGGGGRIIRSSQ